MKVLFVTTCPCFYRVAFFKELGKHCDLTVVFEDGIQQYEKDKTTYYQIDAENRYHIACLKRIRVKQYNYAIGLYHLIRKNRFDVVVFGILESLSCMRTMEVMHRHHLPYILNIDGLDEKDRGAIKNWAGRHFISMAPLLLSPSRSNDHVLELHGAKKENIRRYSFASYHAGQMALQSLRKGDREEACRKLGLPVKRYVLSVSQLIPRKNPLGLLGVWKEVSSPDDVLILIGRGPMEQQVKDMIASERKENVLLVPFSAPETIPLYYRAASFSVLFSHEDAWGLVISESLANGTPVVATNACYAATELLKDDFNGQVIDDDPAQLGKAMEKMLAKDERQMDQMSLNAIQSVKTYTVEHMVEEHMQIFQEFLGSDRE